MRICSRPACAEAAVVRVGMDPGRLLVVLDDRVDEVGGYAVLCERQVQTLTAPRGWWIADLRSDEPQLFRTGGTVPREPAAPRASAPRRPVLAHRAGADAPGTAPHDPPPARRRRAQRPAPSADPAVAAPTLADAGGEPTAAPAPAAAPDLHALLRPESRLLARAFAGAGASPRVAGGGLRSLIPTGGNPDAGARSA